MSQGSTRRTGTPDEIPPFCHLTPSTTPEEAARAAVAELETRHPIDALAILWKLRRASQEQPKASDMNADTARTKKTQPRATAKAAGPLTRSINQ